MSFTGAHVPVATDHAAVQSAAAVAAWLPPAMEKYDKDVLLGRGTFASVYKAVEKEVKTAGSSCFPRRDSRGAYSISTAADWKGCGHQKDRRWHVKGGRHVQQQAVRMVAAASTKA